MRQFDSIKPIWYLAMGILTLSLAHLVLSADVLGWVASAPFLIFLGKTQGARSRFLFAIALVLAWSVCVAKIISPPLQLYFVLLYSIPLALIQLPGYLLWSRYQQHPWSQLLFPAVMTVMEWVQYSFTPFASWGVAAYTQSHNIALMQVVSIFGMPGLSFMVYWANSTLASMVVRQKVVRAALIAPLLVFLGVSVFGSLRFDWSKSKGRETLVVAAVGTDSKVSGLPLPSAAEHRQVQSALFQRTRKAAESEAKLVVWNEAAAFVLPEDEAVWRDSLSALASTLHIALVAAYVVPVSLSPLRYENKYLLLDTTGKVAYTYNKHQPVPGEPAVPGREALFALDIAGLKLGGAICYDYDFPYLAKGFSALHTDVVALPSSDWRGIDPIHTKMAAFRAIEQGHSILRSTRFGLSAAISPFGEFMAQMSSFDQNNKIMIAHLPSRRIHTVYALIGDVLVYACMGFVLLFYWYARPKGRR